MDAVVVCYETPDHLRSCLESLERCEPGALGRVIVIDNSRSEECARVAEHEFPHVQLLRPGTNLGYGSAANLGVALASTEHVLILNADTLLGRGAVTALGDELDRHPTTAVVGPRLIDQDGRLQDSCARFPTTASVLLQQSGLWRLGARVGHRPGRRPFEDPPDAANVPWLLGAALAVRRGAFTAIGGFDPAFFLYYEEVDLCRRLADAGWTTRFCPRAVVAHVGGASSSAEPMSTERVFYRSLAIYLRRHARGPNLFGLRLGVSAIACARLARDTWRAAADRCAERAVLALKVWMGVIGDAATGWKL